jgi:glyceraldehyde 3-phosphate dehydrogenase
MRVPVPTGSITELTVVLKKNVTKDEINAAMKAAADGPMKGIMEYTTDEIVSSDIVGNQHSCIFDAGLTKIVDVDGKQLVTVCGWYDNEMGYSNRMVDVALMLAKSL